MSRERLTESEKDLLRDFAHCPSIGAKALRVIDDLEIRLAAESAIAKFWLALLEACQSKLAEAERQIVRLTEAAQVGLAAERSRDRD